jgi:HEAT repeat protein
VTRCWRRTAHRLRVTAIALSLVLASLAGTANAKPALSNADAILAGFAAQLEDRTRPAAERLQTIRMFKEWSTPQVSAPLIAVLNDPSPEIRQAAADALGFSGGPGAVKALRERIASPDEPSGVKAAAMMSLGRIGDESARPVLLAATNDSATDIREAALWGLSLGKLQNPVDRPVYLRQLAADRAADKTMRCQALQALAESKDAATIDAVTKILESEPPTPMPTPRPTGTQQEIMAIRVQQARDVRAWAVRILGLLDARSALPLMLKSAEDPTDYFLRFMAIAAVTPWNLPEARPVYVRRLEDPFPDVRVLALVALGKAGDRSAAGSILARLSDDSPLVRAQAAATLAELGDPAVRPRLQQVVESDVDPAVQRAAEEALATLPR